MILAKLASLSRIELVSGLTNNAMNPRDWLTFIVDSALMTRKKLIHSRVQLGVTSEAVNPMAGEREHESERLPSSSAQSAALPACLC